MAEIKIKNETRVNGIVVCVVFIRTHSVIRAYSKYDLQLPNILA